MACACKNKKIGQPTAVKQVVKTTVTTPQRKITPSDVRHRMVRRITRG